MGVNIARLQEGEQIKGALQRALRILQSIHVHNGIFVRLGDGINVVPAGTVAYVPVLTPIVIRGWQIVADQSGSAVVDVLRSTFAGFPPASSIAGSEKPTLAAAQAASDSNLTTWTKALAAEDWLAFNVDSAATVKQLTVFLIGDTA